MPRQLAARCYAMAHTSEGLWWWARLALAILVTFKILNGVVNEVLQLYENGVRPEQPAAAAAAAAPAVPVPKPKPTPAVQRPPAPVAPQPANGVAVPEPAARSKPGSGRKPGAGGSSVRDDKAIEQWKRSRVLTLKSILTGVTESRVEALLEEADWDEMRAADIFFTRQANMPEAPKASKADQARAAAKKKEKENGEKEDRLRKDKQQKAILLKVRHPHSMDCPPTRWP